MNSKLDEKLLNKNSKLEILNSKQIQIFKTLPQERDPVIGKNPKNNNECFCFENFRFLVYLGFRVLSLGFIGLCFSLFLFSPDAFATTDDPDQKMLGFSMSNFGEENKKTWDLKGDTLEMFENTITLTNIKANMYGKEEDMTLTADNGTYDKSEGKIHLEDNVVIVSESGAKMITDTLDWLQKTQTVSTEDKVNIYRDNMEAEGVGAVGKTDLKQFSLNKDVQVDINDNSKGQMQKITITCDGPLDIDYQKQIAIFNNNVMANDGGTQEMYADKMTGYFDGDTKKMKKIVAEGNVKIIRGQDTAYSDTATYDADNQKISLVGRPKLIFYSKQEEDKQEK